MKRLVVEYNQFKTFKKYKLDKNIYISTLSKFSDNLPHIKKINEIFTSEISTLYQVEKIKSPYFNGYDYFFFFKSSSNTEYRIDLLFMEDKEVSYNNIYSVSFSLAENEPYSSSIIDYEKLTDKKEMIELLSRIKFIIKNWLNSINFNITFCIGKSDIENKNNIYEYMIKVCFPDYFIKYDYSSQFTGNKAIYIWK